MAASACKFTNSIRMRQSCCRCAGKCFGCNSVANGCSSNCGNMVACGWRSCNIKMPHCRVSAAMQTLYKIIDAILCIAAKQRRATRGCFLPNGSFHKAIAPGEPTPQGVYWLHDDSISSCVCSARLGAVLQPDARARNLGELGAGAALHVAPLVRLV